MLARFSAVLAVTLAIALGGCGGDASPPPSTDPFPLAVGNQWTMEVSEPFVPAGTQTRTVTGQRGVDAVQAFVMTLAGLFPGEVLYSRDASAVVQWPDPQDPYAMALGPRVILRLPLGVGDTWIQFDKTVDTGADFDGDGLSDAAAVRADVVVQAQERVETPAGTFDAAFVVVTTSSATVRGSADGHDFEPSLETVREWYAPGVGLVRREAVRLPSGGVRPRQHLELLMAYRL
jgi:hypothetical protein